MGVIEQRQAARFDVEVAAEVYTAKSVLPANTRNLSPTGVCLDTDSPMEEGSVIGVSLFLTSDGIEDPDIEPLNLKARVIWSTETDESSHSTGARFEELGEDEEAMLKKFLAALGE